MAKRHLRTKKEINPVINTNSIGTQINMDETELLQLVFPWLME
jgi:hypothetical protein